MPAAQQPNQSDNSGGILWTVAAIFAFIAVIWFSGKYYISLYYLKLKLIEISILSYFTSGLADTQYIILQQLSLLSSDPSKVTATDLLNAGNAVGSYLRYPSIAIIIILAVLVYLTNSVRAYKREYKMRDLLQSEKFNWPQVSPVANLDLINTDINKGPWAMSVTPMQFCKRYNLLEEFKKAPIEGMSRKEMNRIEVRLKRGASNKIFATQLGPLWAGVDRLPPHTKALFAIFAARFASDPAALDMIKQLSATAATKLDFSGVDELCKKHMNHKEIQKVIKGHAYVLTVMATMLELARTDGVQASADFLWLKPVDRKLWYMLNTVGRQTPFTEVAGVFAHWVAEKEMGKKMMVPMIEEATNALELALKEIVYRPEE